jgi:glycosyltransferase involved in cell wall biosynthesis
MVTDAGAPPLVTVLLPVHNGERFLDEAIRSIQAQTLTDLELIVLDDGSTDASGAIAQRRIAEDPRLRLISLGRVGLTKALNVGIEAARGRWIARMDADDVAAPERLERQLRMLQDQPDIAALGTYGRMIGLDGRPVGLSRLGPVSREAFHRERAAGLIYLLHPSVVFSPEVVRALGGYRAAYAPSDDIDLWARIADHHLVLTLPEPLLAYRLHTANDSTNRFFAATERIRWTRINALRRRADRPELSWEAFRHLEQQRPWHQRLRQWCISCSQYCYRRGGSMLAVGYPAGTLWVAIAAVLYPPLVFRRLRSQAVFALALRNMQRRVGGTGDDRGEPR